MPTLALSKFMTKMAMKLCFEAHKDQVDKSGIPYVFHPIHLAESMDDEISCTVALLHDVVEDTDVTMEELSEQFPKKVIDALKALQEEIALKKAEQETVEEYALNYDAAYDSCSSETASETVPEAGLEELYYLCTRN